MEHGLSLPVPLTQMVDTVPVILVGLETIVPWIQIPYAADTELGIAICATVVAVGMAQVVPVIPIVANRVVPQIYEHTATITEYGVQELVTVIPVGVAAIALSEMFVVIMGHGFLIPASPTADSAIVIPGGVDPIVRRIPLHSAVIMGHGMVQAASVTLAGAERIVPKTIELVAVIMEHGLSSLVPLTPMADIVLVTRVTPVRIVRLLIKN